MQYLLSTYAVEGQVPGAPVTPDEMRDFMQRVTALEAEMDASDALVFGGALSGAEAAQVVRPRNHEAMTPGPLPAESMMVLAGFYIINAADTTEAMRWAHKVADATNHPIEMRPFRATGRLKG